MGILLWCILILSLSSSAALMILLGLVLDKLDETKRQIDWIYKHTDYLAREHREANR